MYTLWGEPELAALWIDAIIGDARASTVPEIKGLGCTLKQWREPILAWHTTWASNGPTEGLNSVSQSAFSGDGTCPGGGCDPYEFMTWNIGILAPGASVTVQMVTAVNGGIGPGG